MMKSVEYYIFIAIICTLLVIPSCQAPVNGFVLPPGDAIRGKQLFSNLHCNDCHSVGEKVPWAGSKDPSTPHVPLGGAVTKNKTYHELVTSIVHPSHKIASIYEDWEDIRIPGNRSKMEVYSYNRIMTVEELIDLVAFLQEEYKMVVPQPKS
jgi:sulfur-oxidizing protein SoxX